MAFFDPNWQYRAKLTTQNAQVDAAYPYCLKIDLNDHFAGQSDFWDNVQADGACIRVTKTDETTEIPRGVRAMDVANEKGVVYIYHDAIATGSDTDVWLYWGNPSATDYADNATLGMQQTWGRSGFVLDHIEAFSVTFGSSDTSKTVTLSTPLSDTAKTFVTFGGASGNDPQASIYLSSVTTTQIVLTRTRTDSEACTVKGFVVEGASGINVVRGTVEIDTDSRIDVDVSADITDIDKSFVLHSSEIGAGSVVDRNDIAIVYLRPFGGEAMLSVRGTKNTFGAFQKIHYQIVQMDNISVQRNSGTGELGLADTSISQSITAVDLAKSFLLYSARAVQNVDRTDEWSVRGRINSTTQVTFDREVGDGWVNVRWEVVEFTDDTTVQPVSVSMAAATSQSDDTISAVTVANTWALMGGQIIGGQSIGKSDYGSNDEIGESSAALELTSTTNLRTTRDKTSGASDWEAYVIEFGQTGTGREDIRLHYTFDPADTATGSGGVEDMSGNSQDGTFSGSIDQEDGLVGRAVDLDYATPDYVSAADSLKLRTFPMGITLIANVKLSSQSHGAFISRFISKANGSTADDYMLGAQRVGVNNYRAAFRTDTSSAKKTLEGPNSSVAVGSWQQVVGTYDGATMRVYVNGTQVNSVAQTGTLDESNDLLAIGANINDTGSFNNRALDGLIDDVRIIGRALTANEVSTLYNNESANNTFWSRGTIETPAGSAFINVPTLDIDVTFNVPTISTGASVTVPAPIDIDLSFNVPTVSTPGATVTVPSPVDIDLTFNAPLIVTGIRGDRRENRPNWARRTRRKAVLDARTRRSLG